MDDKLVTQIVAGLQEKSSPELIASWSQNDRDNYTEEYFEAVKKVLQQRGEMIPPQSNFVRSSVGKHQSILLEDTFVSFPGRIQKAILCAFRGGIQNRPLKDVFLSLRGRVPRSTYWVCGFLMPYIIVMAIGFIQETFVAGLDSRVCDLILAALMFLLALPVHVKRCHDRNRSGLFLFVGLIPIAGGIWLLVELGSRPGTPGENRFGQDPLGNTTKIEA